MQIKKFNLSLYKNYAFIMKMLRKISSFKIFKISSIIDILSL